MDWLIMDTAVRGAAAMAVALLGLAIWRDSQDRRAASLTALLCLTIVGHLVNVAPTWPSGPRWLTLPVEALSIAVPPMFWLVARAVFVDDFRLTRRSALIAAAYVVYGLAFTNWLRHLSVAMPAGAFFRIMMLGFVVAALVVAWRGRADDLVEERRRLRGLLIWSIGIFALFIPSMEVLMFAGVLPRWSVTVSATGILIAGTANAWFLLGLRDGDLLQRTRALAGPAADRDAPRMLAALDGLMREERLYRDDGLNIAAVAERVGVPEYRLRRLINQQLGHRNFAAYLNGYRLAEVRAALADPAQREVPILTMALDAGFGSLAPFNRAFREAEGMTPTEYRQRARSA